MDQRNKLLMILVLLLAVSLSSLCIDVSAQEDSWIQISCSTQNQLSLRYLGLDFKVFENNSVLLLGSTEFEALGFNPVLSIKIDSIGRSPLRRSGTVTSDVAFFMNVSRDYYIGPDFSEHYHVDPTVESGVVEYYLNFSNSVEKAKNVISKDGPIEKYGIIGRMTFEIMIGNSIGVISQKRFLRVLMQGNADLEVIICSVIIPQEADFKEAKIGEKDMEKYLPYWVDISISINPLEPFGGNLYLEWEMPEEVHILVRILDDPIAGTVIKSLIGLFLGSVFGRYIWTRISERRQKRKLASKLIIELESVRRNLKDSRPVNTPIYDSSLSTPTFYLLNDETVKLVTKAIDEVKRRKNLGYTSLENPKDIIRSLRRRINQAINALKTE